MVRKTLSAVVCVHNEEARLFACLERLGFADEIIVVLDRCTDRSEEIARQFGCRIVRGNFPLEGGRKLAGLERASGEWVIEIDADERVPEELAAEIRSTIAAPGEFSHFQVPIDNYVGQRLVRYGWGGSFGTSSVARLYRRTSKHWGDERLHPTVRFSGAAGARLAHPIRHDVDDDISDMISRLDRYTRLRAQDLVERDAVGGIGENAFRGLRRFMKCYISRKGYREGGWGVLIALMAGLYPLLSTLRARLEPKPSAGAPGAAAPVSAMSIAAE